MRADRARLLSAALVAGLAGGLLTAGCAAIREDAPELSLVDLRVRDVRLFETSAEFTVRITNVSPEPRTFEGGAVSVHVDGRKVGRGVIRETAEVPGLDSRVVSGEVFLSNAAMLRRVQQAIETGGMSYKLTGVLYESTGYGTRKVRTAREGSFAFDELRTEPAR